MNPDNSHDRDLITNLITQVAHHIDHRRWNQLRMLYGNTVKTDYTSLFGGEVQTQDGNDLIGAWRSILTPLTATQHFLGPIEVEAKGTDAKAFCHVRGYHFLEAAPGGAEWMVAGHYVFGLQKISGEWKINSMTLETFYQTGNRKLLEEAAETKS